MLSCYLIMMKSNLLYWEQGREHIFTQMPGKECYRCFNKIISFIFFSFLMSHGALHLFWGWHHSGVSLCSDRMKLSKWQRKGKSPKASGLLSLKTKVTQRADNFGIMKLFPPLLPCLRQTVSCQQEILKTRDHSLFFFKGRNKQVYLGKGN